ncbi:tRNA (cytosine-5-)-methyltransferase ncl1 [Coemansia sp. RSA 1646]|nr:tRNA (cytosine-5-)-methyltransferase ncl1 [Coemansia sp. RSA 1646]
MGRRGRGGFKGKGRKNGEHVNAYKKFEDLRRDNDNFRKYYIAQRIVDEDEFPVFMETMRTILPTNFRITGSRQQAMDIREQIMHEFIPFIKETSIDGAEIEPPHPLEWYPNNFGWQFTIPRIALKKSKELSKFHAFLVTETEVGNISRQEAVSMVPPLFLDVQPDHFVLDMCAAPGSKTAQLIEALHAGSAEGQIPKGLVIANDADYKRACMLVHQMNRLNSPNIVVTNHSGERFPNIYKPALQGSASKREIVQFDRILCDVPCSGDGTTRKNVRVWEKWRPEDAHSLNPLQTKILQRAAYLLKTGGRLVYSTCSLNPVENEAVIAHVLDHFEGALRLVDVSDQLPGLKRRPGLNTWKVMTRDGSLHESFDAVPTEEGGRGRRKYMPKFFPLAKERMDDLHIERCMRIYPHMQNTGGFFVAVLEKTASISIDEGKKAAAEAENFVAMMDVIRGPRPLLPSSSAETRAAVTDNDGAGPKRHVEDTDSESACVEAGDAKRVKVVGANASGNSGDEAGDADKTNVPYLPDNPREDPVLGENPFVFLDAKESELKTILDYYGIGDTISRNGFLSRIENGDFRTVYYVSDSVRGLMEISGRRLRVVNTGIKVFGRNCVKGAGCAFRLVCEGVPLLLPHLSEKYVLEASFSDLKALLNDINPLFTALSPETQERIQAIGPSSSVVMRYDPSKHTGDEEKPYTRLTAMLAIPCWRGHASLSVHMDKNQLCSLIQRVLGRTVNRNTVGGFKMSNNTKSGSETPATETPATDLSPLASDADAKTS